MRKGPGSVYDKWDIYMVIYDTDIPHHGGDLNLANSSVASLLAATLYQGTPDRNHKLWNIVSTEIYIYTPYTGAAGMLLHINGNSLCKNLNHLIKRSKREIFQLFSSFIFHPT